jgi:hypothetical protein
MRYRLRTLLIVLAVGPAVIAGACYVGKPVLATIGDLIYSDAFPFIVGAWLLVLGSLLIVNVRATISGNAPPQWRWDLFLVASILLVVVLLFFQRIPPLRT